MSESCRMYTRASWKLLSGIGKCVVLGNLNIGMDVF